MSATKRPLPDGSIVHSFKQGVPIPSYLLAIAVGNIVEEKVGTGTSVSVFAEPEKIDEVAKELEDLEFLLGNASAYLQVNYSWPTYSVLVLPPSFPYGGMENPQLTFASPTIIVGDKSQVYVATHEIVHSWFGNDVTCENWSNMWLNEGFTVFGERKVSSKVHGSNFAMVESQLGNASLWADIQNMGL